MLYTEGKITGKGFLTHADREAGVNLQVFGPILVVPDGCESWLSRNELTAISKSDAQTKYNTFIDAQIASRFIDDRLGCCPANVGCCNLSHRVTNQN